MGKTVNRKSLTGRRFNALIYGHQSNQTANVINRRSVLRPNGIRPSGSEVIHRIQPLHTVVRQGHRLSSTNSSRPGFNSSHPTLRSLNSTRRVVGSSHSWLQGLQGNLNIMTMHTYNFNELPMQDNHIFGSKNERQLLKKGKYTKSLCTVDKLKSMAPPSSSTQIASSSQHLRKEKDTTPLAHQQSSMNFTAAVGSVHIFHNRQEHLTEESITMFLILEALKQIVLWFYFYLWLKYFCCLSDVHKK